MKKIVILLVLSLLIGGCGNVIKPENPQEAYLVALTEFNNLLELWIKNKASVTDEDVVAKVNGMFELASDAFNAWGVALGTSMDTYPYEIKASQIVSQVAQLLIQILERQ